MAMAREEEARATEAQREQAQAARRINAPVIYATQMNAYLAGNDFVVTFARPHPVILEGQQPGQGAAIVEAVGILQLSPQTMKDLYLLTKGQIEQYEKQFGAIETDFSRRLAAKK